MDLLREEGEQENTRQMIADQNKRLTHQMGGKGPNPPLGDRPWPFSASLEMRQSSTVASSSQISE